MNSWSVAPRFVSTSVRACRLMYSSTSSNFRSPRMSYGSIVTSKLLRAHSPIVEGHPLFHAEEAQDLDGPLAGEHLHQIVLQRDVKARRAGIALSSAAASKLVVDAPCGVPLGADDVKPPGLGGLGRQFDIGA